MELLLAIATVLGQVDITASDLQAQFLENAQRMQTLRVRWTWESDLTAAGRKAGDVEIAKVTEVLKAGVTAKDEEKLTQYLKMLRSTNEKNRPAIARVFDYWSDRRHFQIRSRYNPKTGGTRFDGTAPKIVFPNVEATADQLRTVLRDYEIVSYGPATKSLFRVWQGDGAQLAAVRGSKSSQREWDKSCLPPLALPDDDWGRIPHPIDEFVQQYLSHGSARVVGESVLEGHVTILVECIQDNRSARAFFDPVSAIPRRIEFYSGSIEKWRGLVGPNTDHPRPIAGRIVRDIESAVFTAAGIEVTYPVRGVIQKLYRANSPNDAVSKAQPDTEVREVTKWKVQDVSFNVPMSESNFAMEFPSGTTFQNEPTNELLVVGDAAGHITRLVRGASPPPTDTSATRRWWIRLSAGVGVVIAASLMFYWWRRRMM